MPFYVYAWIASICFGTIAIIAKLTSKYAISNAWLFNFLWAFFVLVFTLPIAMVNQIGRITEWQNLLIAGILSGLVYVFYILALYRLEVSVLTPLFNFRTVFSVLFGAYLLNESITVEKFILIGLIIIGGLFVSADEKLKLRSFFQKSIGIALLLMVILSLMGVFVKKAMANNGYWEVTLWINSISLIVLTPTIPFFRKEIHTLSIKQLGIVILIAIMGTLGTLASNRAYAENVGISSAIISLPISMLLAFLLSLFAPKLLEKHTLKIYTIRFTAAVVMIFAALKLSL